MTNTLRWSKSSCSSGGECLEVAHDADAIRVRDSKNPDGPVVSVSVRAWAVFLPIASPLTP
ncbi:DUF397 domain-containing protein [Streptomyces sp. NPDC059862]|uniref:DUF397 domain-containing protein n=1 Tax=Streptomyces sp. NPDC059862 TaxID=3346975 RepID=UPI0036509210